MQVYGILWGQSLFFRQVVWSRTSILNSSCCPLVIHQVWEWDLKCLSGELNWFTVCDNLDHTSKAPNHKLIHFNFILENVKLSNLYPLESWGAVILENIFFYPRGWATFFSRGLKAEGNTDLDRICKAPQIGMFLLLIETDYPILCFSLNPT